MSSTVRTPPPTVSGMNTSRAVRSTTSRSVPRRSGAAVMSRKTSSSAPSAAYRAASSAGSPSSTRSTKRVPFTTRPSATSRQGMTRRRSISAPGVAAMEARTPRTARRIARRLFPCARPAGEVGQDPEPVGAAALGMELDAQRRCPTRSRSGTPSHGWSRPRSSLGPPDPPRRSGRSRGRRRRACRPAAGCSRRCWTWFQPMWGRVGASAQARPCGRAAGRGSRRRPRRCPRTGAGGRGRSPGTAGRPRSSAGSASASPYRSRRAIAGRRRTDAGHDEGVRRVQRRRVAHDRGDAPTVSRARPMLTRLPAP